MDIQNTPGRLTSELLTATYSYAHAYSRKR